ncbi:MAG: peptide chain release factor N(5)-glutamine methyltransferase [Burkholderiaceae bacterium]
MSTVAQALASARTSGLDALDAQVLLAKSLKRPRSWLLAYGDAQIDAGRLGEFAAWVARRARGEPLAYLTGEKEFCGLLLHVGPAVLIPRPETEHLVQWGVEILRERLAAIGEAQVLDLGTGSGAIALAVKAAHPAARLVASDVDANALSMAQHNAKRLALDIEFQQGPWWAAVAPQTFHLVLCNPPYVSSSDPHLAALTFEPQRALTPGATGLEALQSVVQNAPEHLHAAAWLLVEHGFDQAGQVRELMQRRGFAEVQTRRDLAGHARCTGGCWPGRSSASGEAPGSPPHPA